MLKIHLLTLFLVHFELNGSVDQIVVSADMRTADNHGESERVKTIGQGNMADDSAYVKEGYVDLLCAYASSTPSLRETLPFWTILKQTIC